MKRLLFSALVMLLAWPSFLRADDAKLPTPTEPAQEEALKLIHEAYSDEYENAKTDEEKQALGKKLLSKVAESQDPATKYVLLRVARDVATNGGDGLTAYRAIDQMDEMFDVDALTMKASVLHALLKKARLPAEHGSVAERSLSLADAAAERDDYDTANKLADVALDAARKSRNAELVKTIVARRKELDGLAEKFAEVQAAANTLETDPTDPDANLAVGRYRCVVKGDWENGLPMVALGSDPAWKALAVSDMEGATEHTEQMKLGDRWWDVAEKEEGASKASVQQRAAHWYRKAVPGLTGVVKDKVENRLLKLSYVPPPQMPRIISGLSVPNAIDCSRDARSFQIDKKFDPERNWILSFEFVVPRTPNDKPAHLALWGDGRGGRNVIHTMVKGHRLLAAVEDCRVGKGHGLWIDLAPDSVGSWKSLCLTYDGSTRQLQLYIDEELVASQISQVTPVPDRPMPFWIGSSFASHRHNGQIRKLWLTNSD